MISDAQTIDAYLAELPAAAREIVERLREITLANLQKGFVETMDYGMISFQIPLEISGKTYNGKPLLYVAIGAQKHHVGLYLCGLYCRNTLKHRFEADYAAEGQKLDMGKSCVRIKRLSQINPDAIARAVAALSPEDFIAASQH